MSDINKSNYIKWIKNCKFVDCKFEQCTIDADLIVREILKEFKFAENEISANKLVINLRNELIDMYMSHYLDYKGNLMQHLRSVGYTALIFMRETDWYDLNNEGDFMNLLTRCVKYDFKTWSKVKNKVAKVKEQIKT